MRVRFSYGGAETEVYVQDPDLAPEVASIFPGRCPEEAPQVLPDDEPAVASGAGRTEGGGPSLQVVMHAGSVGLLHMGTLVTFDSVPELMGELELAVIRDLLPQDERMTHVHAAGAVTHGGALLVSGPSGAGKSSLALAWCMAGLPLLGDDVLRLNEVGRLSAFPRLLKVTPPRLHEFGVEVEATPAWESGSEEAWFDPGAQGGWWVGESQVAVIARIEYGSGYGLSVREADRAFGLRLLLDAVQDTGIGRLESMDRFIALLDGARVFDVRFGSSRQAAAALVDLVDSSPRTEGVVEE